MCFGDLRRRESGSVAALNVTAFGGPIDETLHVCAVLPGEMKKLAGIHSGGFLSKKGLKAPAEVGAFPGFQAVTASYDPVVVKGLEHLRLTGRCFAPVPRASFLQR